MKKYFLWLVMVVMMFLGGCTDTRYTFDNSKIQYQGHLNFGPAYSIEMNENLVVLSHNRGVEVVDVSNPKNPKKLSRVKLEDGAFGLKLIKNFLYIAGDSDGFYIVDIKNPKKPEIMCNFKGYEGTYQEVVIKGECAFVGLREGKLIILDIKDPFHPEEQKSVQVGNGLSSMVIVKNFLYLGTYAGIKMIDIKDVRNPEIIDVGLGDMFAEDMDLQGTILYVSSHKQGVNILDINNPLKPELIGSFNDGGEANNSFLLNQKLYVSDQNTSIVEVLDIQDPRNPKKIIEFKNCHPHAVIVRNNMLYIATTRKGLYILKLKTF